MFTLIRSRRRAEDQRVAAFVNSIRRSAARHTTVDESGEWPAAQRTDTVQFPRIILTAAVPLLALALSACASPAASGQQQPASVVRQEAPAAVPSQQELTGTDAGLITEPAPTVQELEEAERATADAVPTTIPAPPAAPTDAAPDGIPADIPAPGPTTERPLLSQPMERPLPTAEQLPEETTGRQIDCPDGTVGTQTADGAVDCTA